MTLFGFRKRRRPRYVTSYKMVNEVQYQCCPGFQGPYCNDGKNPGRRHEISTGGRIPPGGWIQVSQNDLSPNSGFSFDFAHFILEILKNRKILAKIQKKSLKVVISGRTSPRISHRVEEPHPHPSVATPMVRTRSGRVRVALVT